jgi:DeoR family transcriptional regulator of aga operon/DeoR family fructose operon transcriptional repressor
MANTDLLGLERQERIAHLLDERGTLSIAEISAEFSVSEATARRDLAALASKNLIRRVHGGAMRRHIVATSESPILQRQEERADIKQRIGQATARLIEDGDTVLLIGGSTGAAVAHELGEHRDLTVVTDSLIVANALMHHGGHRVIMIGGVVDPAEFAVRGTLARLLLAELQVDKVILGTKAISAHRGLSAESAEEAEMLRAFLQVGPHVIVVTDSSKFRQNALVRVTPIEVIHTLVTDRGIPEESLLALRDKGVEVELV